MVKINRARRAELQRRAHQIRRNGQRAGWSVEQIAAAICAQLPQILPLEAWRLAYGWTRPQTVAEITALYEADRLAAPGVNSSMLCRWEHGEFPPGLEYGQALCRVYRASQAQLGLLSPPVWAAVPRRGWMYGPGQTTITSPANGQWMTAEHDVAALAALRESIRLAIEAEGPAGGPLTHEHLQTTISFRRAPQRAWRAS